MQFSDLTIGYGQKVIATGLNAELRRGRLTCLVGRNGVGKSTLLRTLAGFQPPLSPESNATAPLLKPTESVAVVLTGRPDVHMMTVRDVVALGRVPYTNIWGTLRDEDNSIVDDSIRTVGIEALAARRFDTLSDGECQKVMISKALAQQADIILLDEPTAFLDYPSKADIMLLLKRMASDTGKAILLSTHDMEMARRLADEIWLMTSSHQLLTGTPQALEPELRREHLVIDF